MEVHETVRRNIKAEKHITWMHSIKKQQEQNQKPAQAEEKASQPQCDRCWQKIETFGSETKDSLLLTVTA